MQHVKNASRCDMVAPAARPAAARLPGLAQCCLMLRSNECTYQINPGARWQGRQHVSVRLAEQGTGRTRHWHFTTLAPIRHTLHASAGRPSPGPGLKSHLTFHNLRLPPTPLTRPLDSPLSAPPAQPHLPPPSLVAPQCLEAAFRGPLKLPRCPEGGDQEDLGGGHRPAAPAVSSPRPHARGSPPRRAQRPP
jgi:hypothetical protein